MYLEFGCFGLLLVRPGLFPQWFDWDTAIALSATFLPKAAASSTHMDEALIRHRVCEEATISP
ncbi:MAG: hypothetical protein DMG64_09025, partial [Acidobacteria bacterium]